MINTDGITFMAGETAVATLLVVEGDLVLTTISPAMLRIVTPAGMQVVAQGAAIALDANTLHLKAEELARIEGRNVDLHATDNLREDAGGVGHTYTPDSVHYWLPNAGSGNPPAPPEHPYTGSDDPGGQQ